ncbi:hypothetical protein OJAV_G00166260 [Oryzias javanicus]|uniref:DNA/RNA non-specific endonuclease domain-containing protein n=1 Tax=Oryzias javanicus TaxID=123683 RepID=A0A437CDU2_ORYJA|nr:hypothetical protein OJAV_G00166260 [Oryzias javanicus]
MILLAVLTVALWATQPTGAEVVDTFIYCSEYFYKGKPPGGFDQNAKKICQKTYYSGYYFATLYSTSHRIPLYSAYTFSFACNNQEGRKSGNWFIEPQLSQDEDPNFSDMAYMKSYSSRDSDNIKVKQAIDEDYKHTGYDRGHLNPNSFQCNDGRGATFTLTNSVPMDACFNRVHWKDWEAAVIGILQQQDSAGTAYLVTGAVPSPNKKIPKQGIFDSSDERDFNRVTVPSHIWTAVCYIHPVDPEESFSFGFIGVNVPHGSIQVKTIEDLTSHLSSRYNNNNLKIFEDDCTFQTQKRKSEKVVKKLHNTVQQPMGNRLTMTPDVMNTLHTALSLSDDEGARYPAKRVKITDIKVDFFYDSVQTWLRGMEIMKLTSGLACLLSTPFAGPVRDELRRKRQTSEELVCRIAPEVLEGCATSCLFQDVAKDYYCSTGSMTVACSPTYSDIAVDGQRCKSDHTCGHHGQYDYYWCNTDSSWQYCSPPLPLGKTSSGKFCTAKRNCAKYGSSNFWCNLDDGSWDYCTR